MSFITRTVAFSVALAASSIACAQVYVGASIGESFTKFKTSDFTMDIPGIAESQGKTKTAYKLFVGYDFTKNWAVEGGYADFGKPQYNYSGLGLTGDATVKNTSWFVDAKGTLPLNDQFNFFAKLGLTVNKTEIHVLTNNAAFNAFAGLPATFSKTSNDLHLGVGGEYFFTKNIAARFEYEEFGTFGDSSDNGETKTSMWSVGLGYKF